MGTKVTNVGCIAQWHCYSIKLEEYVSLGLSGVTGMSDLWPLM